MANLNACGKKFKIDNVTGLYKPGTSAFMYPEGQKVGIFFLLWGAYAGLILFRLSKRGRSPFNHYSKSKSFSGLVLLFPVLNYFMFQLAKAP
jgi:hypothetical protein